MSERPLWPLRDGIIALDPVAQRDSGRVGAIDRALRSGACRVAERSAVVAGYGVLDYTLFERGFISLVVVAEHERRTGVGRALMQVLAARCKTRKLFTSANQSNIPMQRLLTGLGDVPSGAIHNLDPEDPELVYCLDRCADPGQRPASGQVAGE